MRAARLHDIGGTLQLDSLEDPVAADGEVLVDIAYASVNPLDVWIGQGSPGMAGANLPWIPGSEASGHVDGQPVIVRGGGLGFSRQGLFRDRASVPSDSVLQLPSGVDLRQVAGLAVVGITAWQALHACGSVQPDDRVVVLGASGGVGSVAVQLAKAAGATVWGQTGSDANAAVITGDGADHVVVSGAEGLATRLADFAPTLVLDPLGGAYTDAVVTSLSNRGRLVVYGTSENEQVTFNMRQMYRKAVSIFGYSGILGSPSDERQVLSMLLAMMADGALHIRLGDVLPLEEAGEAFSRILQRRAGGKLLLDPNA